VQERASNLDIALQTSRRSGIALGIIMTRHLLTADAALLLLRGVSQSSNIKVADLAEIISETGDVPARSLAALSTDRP
jgi:hypothetical protein